PGVVFACGNYELPHAEVWRTVREYRRVSPNTCTARHATACQRAVPRIPTYACQPSMMPATSTICSTPQANRVAAWTKLRMIISFSSNTRYGFDALSECRA